MTTGKARGFLLGGDRFLISTHVNADGDAIGSALAISAALVRMNKKTRIVFHDPWIDQKYRFLWKFSSIESYRASRTPRKYERAILLDSPNLARIGDVAALIQKDAEVLNIDHHGSNSSYGSVNLIDGEACSTAELLLRLMEDLGVTIDKRVATHLYTGVMFDTGRFRYGNLQRAFPIASRLVNLGADPERISESVYGRRSYGSVKVLGEALGSLKLYCKDRVALMELRHRSMKRGRDLDGIVDHAISIANVEVAALLKEEQEGVVRVSLRSRGLYDVNLLARKFHGGGHPNAAGYRINGSPEKVKRDLLREIRNQRGMNWSGSGKKGRV